MEELTQGVLKEYLSYEPMTGIFTWKKASNKRIKVGAIAGSEVRSGANKYISISLLGGSYTAHRLAFLYMTGSFPENIVDHINGVGRDNRWYNLRDVTNAENTRNRRARVVSQTPWKSTGVRYDDTLEHWEASIRGYSNPLKSCTKVIGLYDTKVEAIRARKAAEIERGYHPNHNNKRSWIDDKTLPEIYALNILRDDLGLHPHLHGLSHG